MLDLLVIGAGWSGLSAALTAARAGLRVRVIAKGLGSLHWHAGALDVLGYLPDSQTPVHHPFAALAGLPPQHPCARLGADAVHRAVDAMVQTLQTQGLSFYGAAAPDAVAGEKNGAWETQDNLLLPTAVGAVRPTWRAPAGQIQGDLGRARPMLIAGFRGLRDFYPTVIAEHLTRQGMAARPAWLPLDTLTHRQDSASVHLAQALDEPDAVARLADALKPLVGAGERVGLPALLGMVRYAETLAQLQDALQAPIFEIPTLPPSVPGIRVHRALVAALRTAGVCVEAGMEVIRADSDGRVVRAVETASAGRPLRHRAQAFLLATGGVLGGGFRSDSAGRMWEPVFDLPLTGPRSRQAWFRSEFLDPQGHPVFAGGIEVNDGFQPVAPGTETRCFENLWAAGNGLGHSDAVRERSVEGLAIATGVAAAQAVIAHARG